MKKLTKIKTNYYSKEILKYLFLSGAFYVAASSPYFVLNLLRNNSKFKNYKKRPLSSSFNYLKKGDLSKPKKKVMIFIFLLPKKAKRKPGNIKLMIWKSKNPKMG